jgi:hypothetical protein
LSALKALTVENSHIVVVRLYTMNNPTIFDANNRMTNQLTPAFNDELGNKYWMAYIGDGIIQHTILAPEDFDISSRVNNSLFNYNIVERHGKTTRDDQ